MTHYIYLFLFIYCGVCVWGEFLFSVTGKMTFILSLKHSYHEKEYPSFFTCNYSIMTFILKDISHVTRAMDRNHDHENKKYSSEKVRRKITKRLKLLKICFLCWFCLSISKTNYIYFLNPQKVLINIVQSSISFYI